MRTQKYFFNTNEVLQDRLLTKIARREDLIKKLDSYDKEIHSLETELLKRGAVISQNINKMLKTDPLI